MSMTQPASNSAAASAGPSSAVHRLSVGEKLGYGISDMANNFVWRGLMVFLPFFHTDVLAITAAASGTLLLVCRLWDGLSDVAVGFVADRTQTRWGKFRPWILGAAAPLGLFAVLTFWAPEFSYTGRLIWAYATYSVLILLYTVMTIPYSALMGVMSADPLERASVSSYRFMFAFLGGLCIQGLALPMVDYFGGHPWLTDTFGQEGETLGYKVTMTLFAIIAFACYVITFLTTRERVQPARDRQQSVVEDTKDLVRNRPWLILAGLSIVFVTFTTLKASVTIYYFAYYVDNRPLASAFMAVGLVGAILGAAATGRLAAWLGRRRLMLSAIVLCIVSSALLYLPGANDTVLIFALSTVTEFATGPVVVLLFAMLGDAADYSEWRNHRRATGLIYSAGSLAMKFGSGLGGAVNGWMLGLFGYVQGAESASQSELTVYGIRLLISVFPAAAGVFMLLFFLLHNLDDATVRRIETDLEARRTQVPA